MEGIVMLTIVFFLAHRRKRRWSSNATAMRFGFMHCIIAAAFLCNVGFNAILFCAKMPCWSHFTKETAFSFEIDPCAWYLFFFFCFVMKGAHKLRRGGSSILASPISYGITASLRNTNRFTNHVIYKASKLWHKWSSLPCSHHRQLSSRLD